MSYKPQDGAPQLCLLVYKKLINPMKTIVISTINHS